MLRVLRSGWLAACLSLGLRIADAADEPQTSGPPRGEVQKYSFDHSRIFPGTVRDYWVYVPKQYDPAKPACVYVGQDGVGFGAAGRLRRADRMEGDAGHHRRLHHARPGEGPLQQTRSTASIAASSTTAWATTTSASCSTKSCPRSRRKPPPTAGPSGSRTTATTAASPASRSGAICAFTAAWERPDAFSRVFSSVGTYVGLRGGNNYPTLIRKYEPKPIRIFLEDGTNDQNIAGGDWWMANQEMERAFRFAGYEVNHAWGEGGHNDRHATEVFPDAMRWLWKDWPKPVKAGAGLAAAAGNPHPRRALEARRRGLQIHRRSGRQRQGRSLLQRHPQQQDVQDRPRRQGHASSSPIPRKATARPSAPTADSTPSPAARTRSSPTTSTGKPTQIADGFYGNDIVVLHDGGMYVTNPVAAQSGRARARSGTSAPRAKRRIVDTGLKLPNGIAVSPDQSLLYVAESRSHWVWSYQIQPDGSLAAKQRYFHLHMPDRADNSGVDGIRVDRDGRLYSATDMGIQVSDPAGRVSCIIPTPNGDIANLCFGGPHFDTLYATCRDRVYKRRVKTHGANAFEAPIKPAPPRL